MKWKLIKSEVQINLDDEVFQDTPNVDETEQIQPTNDAKQMLRDLVYQVNNGGFAQYCWNGYADELLDYVKSHDIIKELGDLGCPADGIAAMKKVIEFLQSNEPMEECPYCNGTGSLEEEDENGDIEEGICYECGGEGSIHSKNWANSDIGIFHEVGTFEKWFYSLNMYELDDWTGQSHTHSVMMDMMKNK